MGLRVLNRLTRPSASLFTREYGIAPEYWMQVGGEVQITNDKSLTIAANYACRRNIADDCAKLPFKMLRYGVNAAGLETRTSIPDDPIAYIMNVRFNPFMTAITGRAVTKDWAVGIGDSYGEVVRDQTDTPREIWPIHPSRMPKGSWIKKSSGYFRFKVFNDNATFTWLDEEDCYHQYGFSLDGRTGCPVVQLMMNTLGLTSAVELFLRKFYENQARPACVLTTDEVLSKETRDELRKQWAEAYSGPYNAGKTAVMDNGLKLTDFKSDFKAMEMTDLKKLQKNDIAMIYRMPMNKLQDVERAQGWATLDATEADYVNSCLMPWIIRDEQDCQRQLMKPYKSFEGYPSDVQAHIETKGLLRGDVKTRMAYLQARANMATITPNEIRELEDENPSDDPAANVLYIQGAMIPLNMAGKIQQQAGGGQGDNIGTGASAEVPKEKIESFALASRLGKLTNGTH